jgi:hypothetical protein
MLTKINFLTTEATIIATTKAFFGMDNRKSFAQFPRAVSKFLFSKAPGRHCGSTTLLKSYRELFHLEQWGQNANVIIPLSLALRSGERVVVSPLPHTQRGIQGKTF